MLKTGESSVSSDANKAYNACLRALARQDRSAHELTKKFTQWYTAEAVASAIERLNERGYLKSESLLAERQTEIQRNKGRGRHRINQELKKRGLPVLPLDQDKELDQCRRVFDKKFGHSPLSDHLARVKAARFLATRGFDQDIIKKVIYEKR